jgi:membrane protease subunit (stomatin/prohibitin family)
MPGLLRGMARTAVVAGTATHVSNNVSRRQAARYAQEDQAAQPMQAPVDDTTAQLQQLAELKNQGIITQEEFDAKKKLVLGI